MRYHNITKDDMKNGEGLRVVLWLSGCSHKCPGCHNQITWDPNDGLLFDDAAKKEIFDQLDKNYISGITFSGGDPLHEANYEEVGKLIQEIRENFPKKTIWMYTGYTWESIQAFDPRRAIVNQVDVLVDGPFIKNLLDVNYPWAGSTNQRVILVQDTLNDNGNLHLWQKEYN